MATTTLRQAAAPSLWDLAEKLEEHRTDANTLAGMLADYLEQIVDLDDQKRAFTLLSSLRGSLAAIQPIEGALQALHVLES